MDLRSVDNSDRPIVDLWIGGAVCFFGARGLLAEVDVCSCGVRLGMYDRLGGSRHIDRSGQIS